jgi:hypothetical protein
MVVKVAEENPRQELPEHRRLAQENGQVPHQFRGQQDDDEVQGQRDGGILPRSECDCGKQEDGGEDQGDRTPRRPARSSMNCFAVRPLREPAASAHRSASSRSVAGSTGRPNRRAYDTTTARYVSWSNR